MWTTLVWWRQIDSPEALRTVTELQQDSLRFLSRLIAVGYLLWHLGSLIHTSTTDHSADAIVRQWALFPIVAGGALVTEALQRRGSGYARGWFLLSSLLSITAAVWLLAAPQAALFYALLALAAVVLCHPLAGLGIGAVAGGLVVGLHWAGPFAFLGRDRLAETSIAVALAIAAAWALGRLLVTAVDWSTRSSALARRNAEEARANRAELVQALKQLDHAYYRIQRANAALELAWKAADAAERSKTEFVTNISHELRTPLNLIIGFSELILTSPESYERPLPSAYRGDLNAVYRSAQHLLTLTNDVIDLARVGMGRLALIREPVDLAEVIGDAGAMVQQYVEAKGLWLRWAAEPGLPLLQLDRLRIRQVLLNLLTNAARFTQRGGITITATVEERWVVVTVTDTGRGVPS